MWVCEFLRLWVIWVCEWHSNVSYGGLWVCGFVGLELDYAISTVSCIILQPPFRSMIIVTMMNEPRFVNQFHKSVIDHFDN